MRDAAFICVVGSHLRQQVERLGIGVERIRVTCMGLDTAELAPFAEIRSYTREKLHVVTVARLHPGKGHYHALAAIHRGIQAGLNLHYTIAGEGWLRDVIKARVEELGLVNYVTMTGSLSETEVFDLLAKADAFLLPSTGLGEAWPVSVMEAMATGLPVIASEIGATPEMITSGENGFLVPQGDEEAIFQKILLLANDLNVRRRVGEAAKRTAQKRFDIAVTAKTLRDAIQETVATAQRFQPS